MILVFVFGARRLFCDPVANSQATTARIKTSDAPVSACFNPSSASWYPVTLLFVLTWLISAATPAACLAQAIGSRDNHTGSLDIVKCRFRHLGSGVENH